MSIVAKLRDLGFELPEVAKPVAAYVPSVKVDNLVYTSGQLPVVGGELKFKGRVGQDITPEQAYEAAQICCLNCLAAISAAIGGLEQIERVVKVTGFVNSAPGFSGQPKVVNGASELLSKLFGDAGLHARSAVGVAGLPLDAAVEVEMIVKVK